MRCPKLQPFHRLHVIPQVDLLRDTVVYLNYDDLAARKPFEDFQTALVDEPECILAALGVGLCAVRTVFMFLHCVTRAAVAGVR